MAEMTAAFGADNAADIAETFDLGRMSLILDVCPETTGEGVQRWLGSPTGKSALTQAERLESGRQSG